MTTAPGPHDSEPLTPGGITRRHLLAMGMAGAVGVTAFAASPAAAQTVAPRSLAGSVRRPDVASVWLLAAYSAATLDSQIAEHFVGPRTPVAFTAVIPQGDGGTATRDYPRGTPWSALTQDNVDARVWAGVHFRFSDAAGAVLGRQVGDFAIQRLRERH